MAKIYTSYYARFGKFDPNKFYRIQISRYAPIECDNKLQFLYPSNDLLWKAKYGNITDEEYNKEYVRQIQSNVPNLVDVFNQLSKVPDKDIVLFCYEAPNMHCHRHTLSKLVNDLAGETLISEFLFI